MADEVRADPVKLCELAGTVTELAGDLRDGIAAARVKFVLPTSVFGNSSGAGVLDGTYSGLVEDAGAAVEDVAGVYEGDVDRIYRIAFHFQELDLLNANDIGTSGTPPVEPTPY